MSNPQRRARGGSKNPPPRPEKGKIIVMVDKNLEKEFREAVFKRYGLKRGNITKATEEAITDWIKKQQ